MSMGKMWEKFKAKVKENIAETKKINQEIAAMGDKELKKKAIRGTQS